ncbi:MAG: hypothetical protein IPL06_18620 [Betaproteobacteria bacterium]|nr:hypothetical protein [Betaproteobacteria bacterium]
MSASFLANVAPVAQSVAIAPNAVATPRFGSGVAGTYAYHDADGDLQDTGASGSAYRFILSDDATLVTAGDNVVVASGVYRRRHAQLRDPGRRRRQVPLLLRDPEGRHRRRLGRRGLLGRLRRRREGPAVHPLRHDPGRVVSGSGTVSVTGGDSGIAVVLANTTPAVCSLAGSTVTGITAGSCILTANQAGNAAYHAAPQGTLTFTIGKGDQAIAFAPAPTVTVGTSGSVGATGGASGRPVVFSNVTPAVCALSATR